MIADPLTLRDCCLVTDGGAAIVVTSAERAAHAAAPARPRARAPARRTGHRHITGMPDADDDGRRRVGRAAFAEAGLSPADVDVAQIYDAFTITPILFLEDLGFCAKGDGGPFAASGAIAHGGALPMNTNGGGLSYTHPGMYGAARDRRGGPSAARRVRRAAGRRAARSPSLTATVVCFPPRRRSCSAPPRRADVL